MIWDRGPPDRVAPTRSFLEGVRMTVEATPRRGATDPPGQSVADAPDAARVRLDRRRDLHLHAVLGPDRLHDRLRVHVLGKGFASYIEVTAQVGILGATVSLLMIAG